MRMKIIPVFLLSLISGTLTAQEVKVTPLTAPRNGIVEIAGPERAPFNEIVARYLKAVGDQREVMSNYPGKEGRMIEVSYPPGVVDPVHVHNAHAFVYVLEGQIVMQLKGQPAVLAW